MNTQLQKLFLSFYTPELTQTEYDSVADTERFRQRLVELCKKYNFASMFDSGCNDCIWMSELLRNVSIQYQGGDISPDMIDYVRSAFPALAVQVHDATTQSFPQVELLFVRDVTIHLNNADKNRLWQNWLMSGIPWILITHTQDTTVNEDFEYSNNFPFASVNWEIEPWSFPKPIEQVWEYEANGRCMALWHRTQFIK